MLFASLNQSPFIEVHFILCTMYMQPCTFINLLPPVSNFTFSTPKYLAFLEYEHYRILFPSLVEWIIFFHDDHKIVTVKNKTSKCSFYKSFLKQCLLFVQSFHESMSGRKKNFSENLSYFFCTVFLSTHTSCNHSWKYVLFSVLTRIRLCVLKTRLENNFSVFDPMVHEYS